MKINGVEFKSAVGLVEIYSDKTASMTKDGKFAMYPLMAGL